MRFLFAFIRKANRTQAIGLITIGLTMLICSNLAEEIADWTTHELVELTVILSGVVAAAVLFHPPDRGRHRD